MGERRRTRHRAARVLPGGGDGSSRRCAGSPALHRGHLPQAASGVPCDSSPDGKFLVINTGRPLRADPSLNHSGKPPARQSVFEQRQGSRHTEGRHRRCLPTAGIMWWYTFTGGKQRSESHAPLTAGRAGRQQQMNGSQPAGSDRDCADGSNALRWQRSQCHPRGACGGQQGWALPCDYCRARERGGNRVRGRGPARRRDLPPAFPSAMP